ncbi:MAG: helix-turn-helix domain-containing protein [Isosphaeraceae bacterium]
MSIQVVQRGATALVDSARTALFEAGFRFDLASSDPDEHSERAAYWGLEHVQLGSGHFQGRLRAIHSGRVQLSHDQREPGLITRGLIPAGTLAVSSVIERATPVLFNGTRVNDARLMFGESNREFDLRMRGRVELITIAVNASFFEQHARALVGPAFLEGDSVRLLQLRSPESRNRLNRQLLDLLHEGLDTPDRLREAGVAAAWEARLLDAWLADVVAPDPNFSSLTRHTAAKRAEDFLRANLDRPVSLGELCQESGVPQRTLMLGFGELFGVPPGVYHRVLRLNRARRELLRAGPHETSVAAVALRWGFDHLGRFARDYRRMFGVSPIETLRG